MATFTFDDFVFDDERCELWRRGAPIRVERQPLEVLSVLIRNSERIVTKDELVSAVWQGRVLSENVITVSMARLRKALGDASPNRYVATIYGQGYRFIRTVSRVDAAESPESAGPARRKAPDEPFVGRADVLVRLRNALTLARSSRGSVSVLLGEAGIGKTRAAEVLQADAREQGFLVSSGRCHAFEDEAPLGPWLQVIRSGEEQAPQRVCQSFDILNLPQAARLNGSAPSTHEGTLEAPGAWHRTVEAFRELISSVTAKRPWLIVLEDVQWADAATIALLTHLVTDLAQRQILIVLTVRDTALPVDGRRQAIDYVLGHRDSDCIALPRLCREDVESYVLKRFGIDDPELQEAIFLRSEGNPFFMIELLRPWTSGLKPSASDLKVSGHALDIIRQGLRRLDTSASDVLSAAATIGRTFDLGLLSAVTERPVATLLELLECAIASRVIVPEHDSNTTFEFSHELIGRVLYEDLSRVRRAQLHKRVADALLARGSAGKVASAQLAHHLLQAGPYADTAQTVGLARQAAAAAMQVGAYSDACGILRRSLDALRGQSAPAPSLSSALLYDLANCERAAGESGSAQHFAEAVRIAREHGIVDVLFAAGVRMSGAPGAVPIPNASAVLQATLAGLPSTDYGRRTVVLSHLAWTAPNCRDSGSVETLLSDAERLAREAGLLANRELLRARLYFAGGPGDHNRFSDLAARLEQIAGAQEPLVRAFARAATRARDAADAELPIQRGPTGARRVRLGCPRIAAR